MISHLNDVLSFQFSFYLYRFNDLFYRLNDKIFRFNKTFVVLIVTLIFLFQYLF